MSRLFRLSLAVLALIAAGFAYTKVMARVGSGTPPAMAAAHEQADLVLVDKSARLLRLMRGATELKRYPIALGGAPTGHKTREGDQRTPEGEYLIDWRNPNSIAHLSLHISYPNDADAAQAAQGGYSPGGNIMIHGLPNGWGFLAGLHTLRDWTDGCIGVTNSEMREIWALVPNGTPIRITG